MTCTFGFDLSTFAGVFSSRSVGLFGLFYFCTVQQCSVRFFKGLSFLAVSIKIPLLGLSEDEEPSEYNLRVANIGSPLSDDTL